MIGRTISHYTILEKLGEGGMGIVYKAEDTKLKRIVAIKFLPERLSVHNDERERFAFEAQAASALNHPSICTIFDIDEAGGETFMVMEYVEGVTLREWIRLKAEQTDGYRKQGIRDSVDIATQIAEGLEKAHEKGIIHRDVKSENIMVTDDLRVKIMDFGLAKLRGVSKLTKMGSTIGTVAYMSPEQVEGSDTDHRTDIFSFGVVMYELLAGQLPFRAAHETAMMYEIINVKPKPVSELRASIEEDLNRIVMKCLEKNRDERYQSMREVAVDLRRFRRDSTGKATDRFQAVSEYGAGQATAPTKSPTKMLIVAGAAIALIGIGAWFYMNSAQTGGLESLAVLPFTNVGTDAEKEYLTEGITENIINKISGLAHLRVVPRSLVSRYKGKEVDPREAGKDLNVSAVLTGKVVQRGDQLTIQTELIDVRNVSQLWGEQYNRKLSDLASVEADIVAKLTQKLHTEVSSEEHSKLDEKRAINPEAYQLYLKGRYFWNKRDDENARKAMEYFQKAIEIDPAYAEAYAGVASCYAIANPWHLSPGDLILKVRTAAKKALDLDPNLAEAHAALFIPIAYFDYDFEGGLKEIRRALELDPNFATGHHWLGEFLIYLGRFDEGIAEYKRALDLDPLSLAIASDYGKGFYFMRQYDKSIEQMKKTIDMDPNFVRSHFYIADTYLANNQPDEAARATIRGLEAEGHSAKEIEEFRNIYERGGWKGVARDLVEAAEKDTTKISGEVVAAEYLILGNKDKAMEWLNRLYGERSNTVLFLKTSPAFDSLRNDSRFIALLKKAGLE